MFSLSNSCCCFMHPTAQHLRQQVYYISLRLWVIMSASLLSRKTGAWTEIWWIQPTLLFKTRSKRFVVLKWNRSCFKACVGLRESAASFQGILETPQISQTSSIFKVGVFLVRHAYWTVVTRFFSGCLHEDPGRTSCLPSQLNRKTGGSLVESSCISSRLEMIDS